MSTSLVDLVTTLQDLGDATSRNLEFSYRDDVPVSYGEETITEGNLLELRRHHSDVIHLRTFSKHIEAKNGSDWQWYLVGQKRTLRMRVQAKRVQRNNVLKITHEVRKTGRQQRDRLIETALADRMRPMYCVYCTEPQRHLWRHPRAKQAGCLLADARNVPLHTRSLWAIEWACWPWHYLFEFIPPPVGKIYSNAPSQESVGLSSILLRREPIDWDAPAIIDLNEDTGSVYDNTGVGETTPRDLAMVNAESLEELRSTANPDEQGQADRGVQGVVAVDVRSLNPQT